MAYSLNIWNCVRYDPTGDLALFNLPYNAMYKQLKLQYFKAIEEHHPDKLMHLTAAERQCHEEKAKLYNAAKDRLDEYFQAQVQQSQDNASAASASSGSSSAQSYHTTFNDHSFKPNDVPNPKNDYPDQSMSPANGTWVSVTEWTYYEGHIVYTLGPDIYNGYVRTLRHSNGKKYRQLASFSTLNELIYLIPEEKSFNFD